MTLDEAAEAYRKAAAEFLQADKRWAHHTAKGEDLRNAYQKAWNEKEAAEKALTACALSLASPTVHEVDG